MENYWKAYYKLDNTCCLNSSKIEYNLDKEEDYGTEYEGEYDPNDTDCKDVYDMVDCIETIEAVLKAVDVIKKKVPIKDAGFYFGKPFICIGNEYFYLTEEELNALKGVFL